MVLPCREKGAAERREAGSVEMNRWYPCRRSVSGPHHFLRLAEGDVLLALAPRLALLDVHEADERHGPAPHKQDGEEDDDDGGGADQLALLDGLQAQVEAQRVGDGASQA